MQKNISFKRVVAFAFAVIMAVAFMPTFGNVMAQAKTKKPKGRLVKSVTVQEYNNDSGKWQTASKMSYTYNKKKDPTAIKELLYEKGNVKYTYKVKNTFKYKKGKRYARSMKVSNDSAGTVRKWTYNKKGLPTKYYFKVATADYQEITNAKKTYTKAGYLKTDSYDFDYGGEKTNYKMKYITKVKNGLATKITSYYYDDGVWKKDSTYTFNKKGLLTKIKTESGWNEAYTYKMKNGRVVQCVMKFKMDGESYRYSNKYKFTYTKKTAKKKRYSMLINSIVEGGSVFYWF